MPKVLLTQGLIALLTLHLEWYNNGHLHDSVAMAVPISLATCQLYELLHYFK